MADEDRIAELGKLVMEERACMRSHFAFRELEGAQEELADLMSGHFDDAFPDMDSTSAAIELHGTLTALQSIEDLDAGLETAIGQCRRALRGSADPAHNLVLFRVAGAIARLHLALKDPDLDDDAK